MKYSKFHNALIAISLWVTYPFFQSSANWLELYLASDLILIPVDYYDYFKYL